MGWAAVGSARLLTFAMFEGPVQDLIDELGKLPGIGPKSAQRIAFHLLSVAPPDIDRLTAAWGRVRDGVQFCDMCGNVSDAQRCRICSDAWRDGLAGASWKNPGCAGRRADPRVPRALPRSGGRWIHCPE